MKVLSAMALAVGLSSSQAYSMTMVETAGAGGDVTATATNPAQQSGKLGSIFAARSRIVIGGVIYAYNPLTTVVTINAKRATISELREGEVVRFRTTRQSDGQPDLLTSISAQRQ